MFAVNFRDGICLHVDCTNQTTTITTTTTTTYNNPTLFSSSSRADSGTTVYHTFGSSTWQQLVIYFAQGLAIPPILAKYAQIQMWIDKALLHANFWNEMFFVFKGVKPTQLFIGRVNSHCWPRGIHPWRNTSTKICSTISLKTAGMCLTCNLVFSWSFSPTSGDANRARLCHGRPVRSRGRCTSW